jgi:hypothetical protein
MNKKKLAPILLFSLFLSQSPSQALVGGPFDNNQVPGGGADGTYSAVLTGRNLLGMAEFGIGSYSGFEGNGRFAVFHEGAVHYGVVSGTADLASKRVAAGLLGVAGLPSETTGSSANVGSGAGQALTVRSSAEGAFTAVIKGFPQQLLFEGDGAISTTANAAVTSTGTVATTVTTIILPTAPQTGNQGPQTTSTTTTQTFASAVTRSETPFKVRGSRTSRTPYAALNSFAALAPLVPSSPSATASATAAPAP